MTRKPPLYKVYLPSQRFRFVMIIFFFLADENAEVTLQRWNNIFGITCPLVSNQLMMKTSMAMIRKSSVFHEGWNISLQSNIFLIFFSIFCQSSTVQFLAPDLKRMMMMPLATKHQWSHLLQREDVFFLLCVDAENFDDDKKQWKNPLLWWEEVLQHRLSSLLSNVHLIFEIPSVVVAALSTFQDRFSISASSWACWYSKSFLRGLGSR